MRLLNGQLLDYHAERSQITPNASREESKVIRALSIEYGERQTFSFVELMIPLPGVLAWLAKNPQGVLNGVNLPHRITFPQAQ